MKKFKMFVNERQNKDDKHFKYDLVKIFYGNKLAYIMRDWTWNHVKLFIKSNDYMEKK